MNTHVQTPIQNEILVESRPVLGDISIVIPTLGRPILAQCLHHVAVGSAWPAEILIVDQGSSPDIDRWCQLFCSAGLKARHIPSRQRGRSAGINRGLEQVRTRFVAVTDDDCFVDINWLPRMAGSLYKNPEAIITGRVDPAGEGDVDFCVVTSPIPRIYDRPQLKVHPLIGGNMGAPMDLVERIGLFDEHPSVRSAEDSDWGYRALRLGIPIIYDPDIVVSHYSWRNAHQRASRYQDYARSQGGFYGKYLSRGDRFVLLQAARDLLRGPVRWLRGIVLRNQDMVDRGRADTLFLIPGILAGFRHGGDS
jgi:GT2 family glycosyltransferase